MSDMTGILRNQIRHAYENAPAIRNIMDNAGLTPDDVQSLQDLSRIPVTGKDTLQRMQQVDPPFGGFLAIPLHQLKRIYLSPGPIYDAHGFDDDSAAGAVEEAFAAVGLQPGDIVINAFMYHMVPAGLLFDEAATRLGATVVPMGPGNAEAQVKVMIDLQATAYIGTPSFLQIIYEKAEKMKLAPEAMPLKKAFFTAEPYSPSQRQFFEEKCGLVTAQSYATADLGIIAYERPGKPGLLIPRNIIVEIASPETGEALPDGELGEVVVTTLNKTYPLIRFGTGDLSIMEAITDSDGSSRKQLQGWLGRSGEAIKVRGMFLHPNAIKKAAAQFDNIKAIQAVIERKGPRDRVSLHVILANGSIDTAALAGIVRREAHLSIDEVKIVTAIDGKRIVRDARTFD